jgi:hypothetical protein
MAVWISLASDATLIFRMIPPVFSVVLR